MNFKYGGEHDPPPTASDSLALYNNTQDLLNYYSKDRGYEDIESDPIDFGRGFVAMLHAQSGSDQSFVDYANNLALEKMNTRLEYKDALHNTSPKTHSLLTAGQEVKKEQKLPRTNRSDDKYPDSDFELSDYYQKVDENKYYQRERQHGALDLRSEMPLYDSRIQPTVEYKMVNRNESDQMKGDHVSFYGYDPAKIKPWHLKTEEEKNLIRAKRKANKPPPPSAERLAEVNAAIRAIQVPHPNVTPEEAAAEPHMNRTISAREPANSVDSDGFTPTGRDFSEDNLPELYFDQDDGVEPYNEKAWWLAAIFNNEEGEYYDPIPDDEDWVNKYKNRPGYTLVGRIGSTAGAYTKNKIKHPRQEQPAFVEPAGPNDEYIGDQMDPSTTVNDVGTYIYNNKGEKVKAQKLERSKDRTHYKEGGEYSLSQKDIDDLVNQGYKIEYL